MGSRVTSSRATGRSAIEGAHHPEGAAFDDVRVEHGRPHVLVAERGVRQVDLAAADGEVGFVAASQVVEPGAQGVVGAGRQEDRAVALAPAHRDLAVFEDHDLHAQGDGFELAKALAVAQLPDPAEGRVGEVAQRDDPLTRTHSREVVGAPRTFEARERREVAWSVRVFGRAGVRVFGRAGVQVLALLSRTISASERSPRSRLARASRSHADNTGIEACIAPLRVGRGTAACWAASKNDRRRAKSKTRASVNGGPMPGSSQTRRTTSSPLTHRLKF
jgi:hypothetical protein